MTRSPATRSAGSLAALALLLAAAPAALAQPTIVEPGWYLAEEFSLDRVCAARWNPADGRIYAALRDTGPAAGIYVFDATGAPTQLVAVENPYGLAIAESGDVFYTLDFPGTIERLPLGSTTPSTWVSGLHAGDDDPIGIAVAPPNANFSWLAPGDALVTDRGNSGPDEIWKWSTDAAEGETVVHTDTGASPLVNPVDVAIGAARAYVVDDVNAPGNGVIYEIRSNGNVSLVPGPGVDRPSGIDVDPATQELIVADAELDRIVRIDPKTGALSDMFTGFVGFAWAGVQVFDHANAILVTDLTGDRVYLFRRAPTTCFGAPFAAIDDTDPLPSGRFGALVATHENLVLVADEGDQDLRLFQLQPDGSWLTLFDHHAPGPIGAIAIGDEHIAMKVTNPGGFAMEIYISPDGSSIPDELVSIALSDLPTTLATHGHEVFAGNPNLDRVHVLEFDPNSMVWGQSQIIDIPTGPVQTGGLAPKFGFSIDCDGTTLMVGVPGLDDVGAQDRGAVCMYKRDPGTGQWTLLDLIPGGDFQADQQFGYDVAISGSIAIAGAPFADDDAEIDTGLVQRFWFNSATGLWNGAGEVYGASPGDHYGMTVAINDTYYLVGAPDDDRGVLPDAGTLYIWQRTGPDSWTPLTTAFGTEAGERVGESYALTRDDLLLLGLPNTDVAPDTDAGVIWPLYLGDCPDCNGDALPDPIQIATGLADIDDDAIPDACEPILNQTVGTIHPSIQIANDQARVGSFQLIGVPPGTWVETFAIDRSLQLRAADPGDPPLLLGDGSLGATANIDTETTVGLANLRFGDPSPARTAPGAAINVVSGAVSASNLTISGHNEGAALLQPNTYGSFTGCRFIANSSATNGSAISAINATQLTASRCTFIGNASGPAGKSAIAALGTSLTVHDSLFLGNHTDSGTAPAIIADSAGAPATVEIVSSSFIDNTSGAGALGVIETNLSTGAVVLNCLFAAHDIFFATADIAAPSTITYCLHDTTSLPGTGNLVGDPLFLAAPDPGPDMIWGTSDDDEGDITPGPGSPAIDAGDSNGYLSALGSFPFASDDLVGNTRGVDAVNYVDTGNDPFFLGVIDIGAVEAPADTPPPVPPCPCVASLDEMCSTDVFDFAIFAANFGAAVPPNTLGDFNGDGFVNVFDFSIFAADFGCTAP